MITLSVCLSLRATLLPGYLKRFLTDFNEIWYDSVERSMEGSV